MLEDIEFFEDHPAAETWAYALAVVALALVAFYIARAIITPLVHRATSHSAVSWDDILLNDAVLARVALFVPAGLVGYVLPRVDGTHDEAVEVIERMSAASFVVVAILLISQLLTAANTLYETTDNAAEHPIKGYVQLGKIFLFIVGGGFAIAALANQSPWFFLSGLGALTAVLLLVFRDTILSLVASVQLTQNDMLCVGDWIEMPQAGVDGDVVDIALHTVKVQNFDKTITTVPTYKLISEPFKNWRGMTESGGRRIKRALPLDVTSVQFLDEAEIQRFREMPLLTEYLDGKLAEIARDHGEVDRRLTNLGTFRAYVEAYLKSHPGIENERLTFLVRQLAPTGDGLPLEVYVFASDTDWIRYEALQADIFDHLIAVAPSFGLRMHQNPGSANIQALAAAEAAVVASTKR